jgi:hypothetical protein
LSYLVVMPRKPLRRLEQRSTTLRRRWMWRSNAGGRPPRRPWLCRCRCWSVFSGMVQAVPRLRGQARSPRELWALSAMSWSGLERGRPALTSPGRAAPTPPASVSRRLAEAPSSTATGASKSSSCCRSDPAWAAPSARAASTRSATWKPRRSTPRLDRCAWRAWAAHGSRLLPDRCGSARSPSGATSTPRPGLSRCPDTAGSRRVYAPRPVPSHSRSPQAGGTVDVHSASGSVTLHGSQRPDMTITATASSGTVRRR